MKGGVVANRDVYDQGHNVGEQRDSVIYVLQDLLCNKGGREGVKGAKGVNVDVLFHLLVSLMPRVYIKLFCVGHQLLPEFSFHQLPENCHNTEYLSDITAFKEITCMTCFNSCSCKPCMEAMAAVVVKSRKTCESAATDY